MEIRNVFAGHPDPVPLGPQSDGGQAIEIRTSDVAERSGGAPSAAAALAEILSRYDVSDISPREFSEMIQKLYEAGVISDQELQQLAAVRHDLENEDVEADESVDLLDFYTHQIKKAQRRLEDADTAAAAGRQLGPLLGRLDWIQKFALIQSNPDAIGLDATA